MIKKITTLSDSNGATERKRSIMQSLEIYKLADLLVYPSVIAVCNNTKIILDLVYSQRKTIRTINGASRIVNGIIVFYGLATGRPDTSALITCGKFLIVNYFM